MLALKMQRVYGQHVKVSRDFGPLATNKDGFFAGKKYSAFTQQKKRPKNSICQEIDPIFEID